MKIKNAGELALNDLRRSALDIAETGFEAVDTRKVLGDAIKIDGQALSISGEVLDIQNTKDILLVAIGKCAIESSLALGEIFGERLSRGIVLDIRRAELPAKFELLVGTHPSPSAANVEASKKIIDFLKGRSSEDLVLFSISGGGSTLLCLPENGDYSEEVKIFQALTAQGADIEEINTLRKHLSLARGGYLASYAYPARTISLIFSDVPGNDPQYISSGPTVKDVTNVEDAAKILAKYDILKTCGLENCGLLETPKEDKYFENSRNIIVASNDLALEKMSAKAEDLGFNTIIETDLTGEAAEAGMKLAERLKSTPKGTVILLGGETTVHVKGNGRGGRSLEVSLAALQNIGPDELILTMATDGRDNQGEFAGAICDIISKEQAAQADLLSADFLSRNDSYPFFEKIRAGIITGDTGSNVSDIIVAIKNK